jgi:hypothetical protein
MMSWDRRSVELYADKALKLLVQISDNNTTKYNNFNRSRICATRVPGLRFLAVTTQNIALPRVRSWPKVVSELYSFSVCFGESCRSNLISQRQLWTHNGPSALQLYRVRLHALVRRQISCSKTHTNGWSRVV